MVTGVTMQTEWYYSYCSIVCNFRSPISHKRFTHCHTSNCLNCGNSHIFFPFFNLDFLSASPAPPLFLLSDCHWLQSYSSICLHLTNNIVHYTYSQTQLYSTQQYSRNTTTCFGPICGPSSGWDLSYRSVIQDVWGVWVGGERDLVSTVGTVTPGC